MKSTSIKGVISILAKPKQMVRAEMTTTCTTGIDTNHTTTFTLLLVARPQHYMWTKLDTVQMEK